MTLPILHQDDRVVAINKPAWAVVHRTRGARGALIILEELRRQLGQKLYPVHRLDRQTSGVLLLAKSATAANTLSEELRESRARKVYLGVCRGVIAESQCVDSPVPEEGVKRQARTDSRTAPVRLFRSRSTAGWHSRCCLPTSPGTRLPWTVFAARPPWRPS